MRRTRTSGLLCAALDSPRHSVPSTMFLLLTTLLLGNAATASSAVAPERRRLVPTSDERLLTYVEDDGARVILDPFSVRLTSTPAAFGGDDLNKLHATMEAVISRYVGSQSRLAPYNVKYVLLGQITSELDQGDSSTLLKLGTGVVRLVIPATVTPQQDSGGSSGPPPLPPTKRQVQIWVREALQNDLVPALQGTDFYYVQTSDYVEVVPLAPIEDSEDDAEDSDEGPVQVRQGGDPNGGSSNVGVIVGSIVGAVVAVTLLALFVHHRRAIRRDATCEYQEQHNDKGLVFNESLETDDGTLDVTAETIMTLPPSPPSSPLPPQFRQPHQRSSGVDDGTGRSLAEGSESEFTVNTEAGDSAALKSLSSDPTRASTPTRVMQPGVASYTDSSSSRAARAVDTRNRHHSESFERERPVQLRKDMLTTSWSGRVFASSLLSPSQQQMQSQQNESVLEPSHFSASEERHQQQHRHQPQEEADYIIRESSTSGESNISNDSSKESLVFQQANFESQKQQRKSAVLLTPPSQSPKHRTSEIV